MACRVFRSAGRPTSWKDYTMNGTTARRLKRYVNEHCPQGHGEQIPDFHARRARVQVALIGWWQDLNGPGRKIAARLMAAGTMEIAERMSVVTNGAPPPPPKRKPREKRTVVGKYTSEPEPGVLDMGKLGHPLLQLEGESDAAFRARLDALLYALDLATEPPRVVHKGVKPDSSFALMAKLLEGHALTQQEDETDAEFIVRVQARLEKEQTMAKPEPAEPQVARATPDARHTRRP